MDDVIRPRITRRNLRMLVKDVFTIPTLFKRLNKNNFRDGDSLWSMITSDQPVSEMRAN